MYYAVQGLTLHRADPGREHVVPGLPAALGAARARPLRAAAVHEPRRPARVLERRWSCSRRVAGLLLWIYGANTNSLIHLYVIGVFTAFTLSQAGMVRYWLRRARRRAGGRKRLVNGVGGDRDRRRDARRRLHEVRRGRLARHRRDPAARARHARDPPALRPARAPAERRRRRGRRRAAGAEHDASPRRVARRGDRRGALRFARADLGRELRAVHVPTARHRSRHPATLVQAHRTVAPRSARRGRSASPRRSSSRCGGCRAASRTSSPSSSRSSSSARRSLEQARRPHELALKLRLLAEPGVVVADVPVVRGRPRAAPTAAGRPRARLRRERRLDARRQLRDRRSGSPTFAPSTSRSAARTRRRSARSGPATGPRVPLEVDEAPYRDIGRPLLGYLRELTADEGTEVLVLMPELVTRGWRRLLHNQRALYVKRLLLFEPNVDPRRGSVPATPVEVRTAD